MHPSRAFNVNWHFSRLDLNMESIIMEHLFRVDLTGIGGFQAVVTTVGSLGT